MSNCKMGTAYNQTGALLTVLTGDLLKALEEQQRAAQENAKANADAQCALAQGSAAAQVNAGESEAQSIEKEANMAQYNASMQVVGASMSTASLGMTMRSSNKLMTQMRNTSATEHALNNPQAEAHAVVGAGVPGQGGRLSLEQATDRIKAGEELKGTDVAHFNQQQLAQLKAEVSTKRSELKHGLEKLRDKHATMSEWSRVVGSSDGFYKAQQQALQADLKRQAAGANAAAELYRGAANPADRETGEAIARIKDKQRQISEVINSLNEAKKGANEFRG